MERPAAAAAVEELLRYDGPIGALVRIVKEPYPLHGKVFKPGERVFLLMNAANRDPRDGIIDVFTSENYLYRILWHRIDDRGLETITATIAL